MDLDDEAIALLRQQIQAEQDTAARIRQRNELSERRLQETAKARQAEDKRLRVVLDVYERIAALTESLPASMRELSMIMSGVEESLREIARRLDRTDEILLIWLNGRENGNQARANELQRELNRENDHALLYQEIQNLQRLKLRAAQYGPADVPLITLNQIDECEKEIKRLRAKLKK